MGRKTLYNAKHKHCFILAVITTFVIMSMTSSILTSDSVSEVDTSNAVPHTTNAASGTLPEDNISPSALEPADDNTATVTTQPAMKEDELLKTMEMPLGDGKTLSLHVFGKKKFDDIDIYGVREIRVYEGMNLIQSILVKEAMDIEGMYGDEEGYTECPSKEETAALKDVNFDGYLDLEIYGWIPNNSIPYYYWCWNNETQQFEYSFCLQLLHIDQENELLIVWYKVENGLYYTDYYRVNEKNELELTNREVEDDRPK